MDGQKFFELRENLQIENKNSVKLKLNDIGEIIFKLKNEIAFDAFGKFQTTGGIVLNAEEKILEGIIFSDGKKNIRTEIFEEFFSEFDTIESNRVLADFSNRYFFLNQFRTLNFYFDYVI